MRTVMRNLFHFLQGLVSGLLYALARGVLALDAFICAVYDLPVWRVLGRGARRIGRSRVACALAVFIPCFVLPGAALTQAGTLVLADGKPLGLIDDPDMLSAAVSEIETSAATLAGNDYALPLSIDYAPTRGTSDQFLTYGELQSALIEQAPGLDTLAVISVDGQQAGVCRTPDDAQALLDRIKAKYTTASDENAEFIQAVHVQRVVAPTDLVSDFGALYDELAPRLDVTAKRSVTYTEEIPYETVTKENDALDQTYKATLQEGHKGEAVVTAEITTVDGSEHDRTVVERTVLSPAQNEVVEIGTKNVGIGTGALDYPLTSYTFTSAFKWRWGRLHGGVDLAVPEGTPVYAADNGKVIFAGDGGGYGNYVILDHQNGMKTLYGHNSQLLVETGDVVAKGDKIALSGNTGNSTGPHLHFEVMIDDEKVDPQGYLTFS